MPPRRSPSPSPFSPSPAEPELGFLLAATLIGLSRIALGLHYPSDVLAGILVGWTAAMLVTRPGASLLARIVSIVSRVTDPLLEPVWNRLAPAPRERPADR